MRIRNGLFTVIIGAAVFGTTACGGASGNTAQETPKSAPASGSSAASAPIPKVEAPPKQLGSSAEAKPSGSASPTSEHTTSTPGCMPYQLGLSAAERPAPNSTDRLFVISFQAKPGVECRLFGVPTETRFLDGNGHELSIEAGAVGESEAGPVVVSEGHEKVIYVSAKKTSQPGTVPATMTFTLPGGVPGRDIGVVDWPGADLVGPLTVTPAMEPVS